MSGYIYDKAGRSVVPNSPCFCMFCGRDYIMTLPHSDAPTPIIGPCCKDTDAAKRMRERAE